MLRALCFGLFKTLRSLVHVLPSGQDCKCLYLNKATDFHGYLSYSVCNYASMFSLLASYFIDPSHIQSDLAAMAICDNPEEYNEYGHFPRDGGNRTKIFGGQQSNEDRQQLPRKVHPVRATNLFPALVRTTEPTYNLPTFHRSLPLSQIIRSQIMTSLNYGRKLVVGPPQLKPLFRQVRAPSPLDLAFGAGSASTDASAGGNTTQVDLRFLTFRGGDFSLQDMVICDREVQM